MPKTKNMDVYRRAAALVHTSVEDARSSLRCRSESRDVLNAALDMIDGKPGEKTRRKLFEHHLKALEVKHEG